MPVISPPLPVLFLMGPTASGKTDLAVAIHRKFAVEVISVDSAMVYRGMDIGTAKPSPDILAAVPHRLINTCDPVEHYSAGRFRQDALQAINEIHAQGKIPLLVGGTGLYFRSLEKGISSLPAADPRVREKLEQQAREVGWHAMHQRLAEIDPAAAQRIHPNDPQRIQRALEVYELTGKTMSSSFSAGRRGPLAMQVIKLIVTPHDRAVLHERIRLRFLEMLDKGLIDEVKALHARSDLGPALPAMRLVGYRQVWRYLDGEINYEQMVEQAVSATRQLAKRQMTWLRSEQNACWFSGDFMDLRGKILKFLLDNPIFLQRV